MSDEKYFSQVKKKGELEEIKNDLSSDKKEKKREGMKKLIAAMTIGKDVAFLFTDVLHCMQTDDLELKKLVYLYLQSYAKNRPDLAILAINTFVKDCEDGSPLIRALAIRTMGSMNVDKISDLLCEPLRKCLADKDPYVRKAAAVGVVKLYISNANLAEDQGFFDLLVDLLNDSNSMVVANAAAAMCEIASRFFNDNRRMKIIDFPTVTKLLLALGECVEWSQSYILDFVSKYTPTSEEEIKSICERVAPKLSHTNSAVVLSAVRIMLKNMQMCSDSNYAVDIAKKIAPSLVTLLSAEAEIQYVALRNISIIIQKYPDVLKKEVNVFFVKYNDPLYVKLEKLDNMIRLVSQDNVNQVLSELNQYALEVDVDFVRKAVRAIGRCAIKFETAAGKCVKTLQDLIETKVNYVVQEAVVVMRDIFRKYPNSYESIVSMLCENLEDLDEPDAKGAFIWIVGQYADRISNVWELLETFVDTFKDEQSKVQLQLLTAVVKAFLYRPTEGSEILQKVLTMATMETDNPDLRDRSYFYWRMLSHDPVLAKKIVLADKLPIMDETDLIEPALLNELMEEIGNIASIYHKPPQFFLDATNFAISPSSSPGSDLKTPLKDADALTVSHAATTASSVPETKATVMLSNGESLIGDLLGNMDDNFENVPHQNSNVYTHTGQYELLNDDLLSVTFEDSLLDSSGTSSLDVNSKESSILACPTNIVNDLLSLSLTSRETSTVFASQVWLEASVGKGMEIKGTFSRKNRKIYMELTITNKALEAMSRFAIQLNMNYFGLIPVENLNILNPLFPNMSVLAEMEVATNGPLIKMTPINCLQVAVMNNVGIFYFSCLVPIHVLCTEEGKLTKQMFSSLWSDIPKDHRLHLQINPVPNKTTDEICRNLEANNIFTVYREKSDIADNVFQSMKISNGTWILAELRMGNSLPKWGLSIISKVSDLLPAIAEMYDKLLSTKPPNLDFI